MKGRGRKVCCAAAGMLASAAAMAWAAGVGTKLYVNGKVASADVIMKDGRAYVPVKDVAAALGMTVVSRSDGFELTREGGANQVRGVDGKIGDDLFNGSFRIQGDQDRSRRQLRPAVFDRRCDSGAERRRAP